MTLKKVLLLVAGLISLVFGAVAAFFPLLPSFPFLLIAGICFAKSSQKLNDWFLNSNLYKNNLESYLKKQGMTLAGKIRVLSFLTISMGIGFYFLIINNLTIGVVILFIVWICHVIYFTFFVKTKDEELEDNKKLNL